MHDVIRCLRASHKRNKRGKES